MLRLRPLHDALREAISPHNLHLLTAAAASATPIRPNTLGAPSIAAPGDGWDEQDLQPLATSAQPFLDQWLAYIPTNSLVPKPSAEPATIPAATKLRKPTALQETPAPTYAESILAAATAAAQLPALVQSLAPAIPAPALSIFPTNSPKPADNLWSPILAFLVLRTLPSQQDPIALFDQLRLRTALANIFSTIGLDGEAKWQAAARVRLLLSPAAAAPNAIRTPAFWSDPDVRWLTGVNQPSGATYFNKERFEELLAWLQLPALITIAQQPLTQQPAALTTLKAAATETTAAAQSAAYNLDTFLAPPPTIPPKPASRKPRMQPAPR
jgi:hypothetical protein